ncbi:MAG: hypothetical protein Q9182_003799 [Xanthomendoza sp. 2 TL-2023]
MPCTRSFFLSSLLIPALLTCTNAQNEAGPEAFRIFNGTGRLPSGCISGYSSARDVVLYNVPYTYAQVLSIIGSYANITWNGINSTTLNGTDNTPGTARFYTTYGIPLTETIKTYSSPPGGPYFEDHTLAPAYNPQANLSIYAPIDITTVTPICGGTASALNFTVEFCSTNITGAGPILHDSHVFDAVTLQEFLGNETFTGCTKSNGSSTTSSGTPSGTGSPSAVGTGVVPGNGTGIGGGAGAGPKPLPVAPFTGGAATKAVGFGAILAGLVPLLV